MSQEINKSAMLPEGTILHGVYRIDSYLASGGFGNTYVATNIEFDERYAIKEFFMKGVTQRDGDQTTVSVSNAENESSFQQQKEKFKKEARRLRQFDNPHIIKVHDLFEENGTAYYVMDYVDGENLAEHLQRTGQPMAEAEVHEILPQILDALKTIHDAGIWHLDLKPANIMIDKSGSIKLIDFGASKQLDSRKGGATTSTAISYTNGYAPREQMEQNYDKFGPWTDLYALGATLYNLLTNKRPPLPSDIDDDMSEDKHFALPMAPNLSSSVKQICLWLMETDRNNRPKDIEELVNIYLDNLQINTSTQIIKTINETEDTIFVKSHSIDINGHEAIDLGLSVLWASTDIGAAFEDAYGTCFLWGDPNGEKTVKVLNSFWSRFCAFPPLSPSIIRNPLFDAATNIWGDRWRMPLGKDFEELATKCIWKLSDPCHAKIIGPNGNHIIIDNRWHWTGEAPFINAKIFFWVFKNNRIKLALQSIHKNSTSDYRKMIFPIRAVAPK